VAARPGSDEDESCAVGSSFSRSFQRRYDMHGDFNRVGLVRASKQESIKILK
jgi:hypothetical protein